MAKVSFKRVLNRADLDDLEISDGQFIVTKTGQSYTDYGNERIPMNGTLDKEMSDVSENAVENRAIKRYIDEKVIITNNINENNEKAVPNAKTVKGYVDSRTLNIKYITDNTFVAPYNCYAEITYQVSGWGYGGNKTAPAITCNKGDAVKITGFEGGTQGHDTIPDSMVSMAIFQLIKDVEYSFGFGGVTGGSTHSGRIIKLIPIYDEE